MARSQLTDKELDQLLSAIADANGVDLVDSIIGNCHEFEIYGSLMPYEKYFRKKLAYRDFDLNIPRFVVEDSSVKEADIQFKRASKFPAPYVNRNCRLMKRLESLLNRLYEGERIQEVPGRQGRRVYYKASQEHCALDNSQKWEGECTLFDEPYSSGRTHPDLTDIRNDFVLIRFNKRHAKDCTISGDRVLNSSQDRDK